MSRDELLRAIAEKDPDAFDIARRAADEYLQRGAAADALAILREGAYWAEAAVRLADVLDDADEDHVAGGRR